MRFGAVEFQTIWFVDFEFSAEPGECPIPICLVAKELMSGQTLRLWQDELQHYSHPPYAVDGGSLFVAYYVPAEISCHLTLGWQTPQCVLDLYVEFRNLTNGLETPLGRGLPAAMAWFGLNGVDALEKEGMRNLAMRGGPFTATERRALLDYCQSDVDALAMLFARIQPQIDMPRAILRGRYTVAAARIEHVGVPIDVPVLHSFQEHWSDLQDHLIHKIDMDYGVYDGRTFKSDRFAELLANRNVPWPQLESGRLALDDETFRVMVSAYSWLEPLRQLRQALAMLRPTSLTVGRDQRNRCLLSIFGAVTGRNTPSNTKFIFGAPSWLRGLIRPAHGSGLAYVDWAQQEFGIAAALSGDHAMLEAYQSGDPYLAFAKQAGAVPPEGTKETHGTIRERFKVCALAMLYGMEADSLALRIARPAHEARELLRLHRQTYPFFWRWSDSAIDHGMLLGNLPTVFGWCINVGPKTKPRTLRNFPMQANGAEMLRLACCLATERGIGVCAPIHDALLIEAPLEHLEVDVARTQEAMAEASRAVLDGFELRSEAKLLRYPERFQDERGAEMWNTVWQLIEEVHELSACA